MKARLCLALAILIACKSPHEGAPTSDPRSDAAPRAPVTALSAPPSSPPEPSGAVLQRTLEVCPGPYSIAGVAASDAWLAVSYDTAGVVLYDARTGARGPVVVAGDTGTVSFSPDGGTLAVATRDDAKSSRVQWFPIDDPTHRRSVTVEGTAGFLEWSLDGRRLYVGESHGFWRVVDPTTGATTARRHRDAGESTPSITHAGAFVRHHTGRKQDVALLDDDLRPKTTWGMPDGDGFVLAASDPTSLVFANSAPGSSGAPQDVAVVTNGAVAEPLGTMPTTDELSSARRADGSVVIVLDWSPSDVYVLAPREHRLTRYTTGAVGGIEASIALSSDGRTLYAPKRAPGDAGGESPSCVVGLRLP